jgi:hypothetical protein
MYGGINYVTQFVCLLSAPPDGIWRFVGTECNNNRSSWINNRNKDILVADGNGGDGDRTCLNAFQRDPDMGVWANRVTSYKVLNDASSC